MDKSKDNVDDNESVFKCASCGLSENYDYKGMKPPFSKLLTLKSDSYVMKDPFSPPNKGQMLVLGSDCSQCHQALCQSASCSLFYCQFYCLPCAKKNQHHFPSQLQKRFKETK